jgi:hypothetical protein
VVGHQQGDVVNFRTNFAEMGSGSEEGPYLRLIDLYITQLYAGE